MDQRTLTFIALAISLLYGAAVAITRDSTVAIAGAVVVALAWIAVGMLSRDRSA